MDVRTSASWRCVGFQPTERSAGQRPALQSKPPCSQGLKSRSSLSVKAASRAFSFCVFSVRCKKRLRPRISRRKRHEIKAPTYSNKLQVPCSTTIVELFSMESTSGVPGIDILISSRSFPSRSHSFPCSLSSLTQSDIPSTSPFSFSVHPRFRILLVSNICAWEPKISGGVAGAT